jgi:CheY-like chemotaxis protein
VTEHPSNRRVLIVEDHPDLRRSLTELLQEAGYQVTTAAHGQEALDYLQTGPLPHLIVLDLVMPVMDGWEFRHRQRQDPALADIPVVVISGGEAPPHGAGFIDAASYLLKPIDYDVLLTTIARHCRGD